MFLKRKNKKAWLRIVEAFLSILILASFLLVVVTKTPIRDTNQEIHDIQRHILRQISLNDSLRESVLLENKLEIKSFINKIKPIYWDFEIEICGVEDVCGMQQYPPEAVEKEIYASEVLISSTTEKFEPKKLKLFVWIKE